MSIVVTGNSNGTSQVQNLNLGFVGLGWIGRKRMEQLLTHPHITCSAIVEPEPEQAKKARHLAQGCRMLPDLDELLRDPSIDGVIIATPSALHARQTIQALEAGKAVFCQKPLGRNQQEVREVITASSKADQLVSIDLSYKFTRAFTSIYEILQSESTGKIFAVDLVFHNYYVPDNDWFFDLTLSDDGYVILPVFVLLDLTLCCLSFTSIHILQ